MDPPQRLAVTDFLVQELQRWVKAPSKRNKECGTGFGEGGGHPGRCYRCAARG